jgi:hypothetical protein
LASQRMIACVFKRACTAARDAFQTSCDRTATAPKKMATESMISSSVSPLRRWQPVAPRRWEPRLPRSVFEQER